MIQVDNYIANPFFDDASKRKDGTFEFFPAAPKHQKSIDSHPELIEYLTCKDITMRTLMQGLFSLNNELLVFHEVNWSFMAFSELSLPRMVLQVLQRLLLIFLLLD